MTDLYALRAELDAGHPVTGEYSVDDATAADEINAVNRTIDRSDVPAPEILAAVKPIDYLAVFDPDTGNAVHRRYFEDIMRAGGTVDLDNSNIRTALQTIFSGRGDTLNAIEALQTIDVSRARELGLGNVRTGTVTAARAL